METIRDRFWMWGHENGSHNGRHNLPGLSRISPAEAAFDLGVPNMILVCLNDRPQPPFDQAMRSFRTMKGVVWSIVGARGSTRTDLDEVLSLAETFPNLHR